MKNTNKLKDYMTITKEEENFLIKKFSPALCIFEDIELQYNSFCDDLTKPIPYNIPRYYTITENIKMAKRDTYCFCTGVPVSTQPHGICPKCGRNTNNWSEYGIVTRNVENFLKESRAREKKKANESIKMLNKQNNKVKLSFNQYSFLKPTREFGQAFFVKKHPLFEDGIILHKVTCKATINDDNKVNIGISQNAVAEIVPGKMKTCFRISPSLTMKESDFSVMTNTKKQSVYYENDDNMLRFVMNNKKFSDYTGLYHSFCEDNSGMDRNDFFMSYLAIYYDYPSVELVVKMGHVRLISELVTKINSCGTQEIRKFWTGRLQGIITPEATVGKYSLKAPKFIADDLKAHGQSADIYELFGDICQLCEVTKEQYERIKESSYAYLFFYQHNHNIVDIVKYGIHPLKIIAYLEKQDGNTTANFLLNQYADYLYMLDIMQIENGDFFPKDLNTAHDNLAAAYNATTDQIASDRIAIIADVAKKYIEDNDDEYFIAIPESVEEIVDEAQQQHNCCGSYCTKVANGDSLLFFIRRKDSPDTSLVTAEYKNNIVNQLYYKNNMPVKNKRICEMANAFCDKLNSANFDAYISTTLKN